MQPHEKLYYQFIQGGSKDVKKLLQTIQEQHPDQQEQYLNIVAVSKQLTENAHFNEAKALMIHVHKYQPQFIYLQAAQEIPQSEMVLEETARVCYIFEDYQGCIDYNKKAQLFKQKNLDKNLSDIGLAYYQLEEYDEAINYLQQALKHNSRYTNALVNLGLVYKHLGNYEKALKLFEEATSIDSREVAGYTNIGNIYYEQQKYESAAIMYLQALDVQTNDEDTLCNLGLVLSKIQYNDYAKIAFEEGININPGNKAILQNYMLFLLEIKQFEKFQTIMNHAKRVLDNTEILQYQKLYSEFQKALNGSASSESLQGLGAGSSDKAVVKSVKGGALKSALKNFFSKRKDSDNSKSKIIEIQEEDKEDY